MQITTKPTRKDLLKVLSEIQNLVGTASQLHANDRDRNGFEKAQNALAEAFELCVSARGFDKPT